MSKKLSVVAVALKTFQDGAVGSAVAGAGAHKGFERAGHVAHARNSGLKVFNMLLGQRFHIGAVAGLVVPQDRKSTRLNSSHVAISYAVFCLKKKKKCKTTDE